MDAEFVLDVAHVNASVALVIDEHGQSASVTCTLFRTCKDEVDVGISVGDETLHAVQSPAVFLFVEGSFEHDTLEVGSSIRLSEVHRHGLTCADTWDVLLTLFLIAELIERVDARLQ